jgi:nicotinamide riboside kinase
MSAPPWVFAIVGAESTGKSTLAAALTPRLAEATGMRVTSVPEVLREWCERRGRTPRIDEQAAIAAEQARRIDAAGVGHEVVVCDTTPLMIAVYSQLVFGDHSLDDSAVQWQRRCRLTLLTALDLPWQPDGIQRDGPHVREPVDAALRALLTGHGLPFAVIGGRGEARTDAALDAVAMALRHSGAPACGLLTRLAARDAAQPVWAWVCETCETCDLPDCERASLLQAKNRLLQRR